LKTHKEKINEWKEKLQRSIGVRDSIIAKQKEAKKREEESKQQAIVATQALNFVEESVKSIRTKTLKSIESVANEALESIYNNSLRLECDFNIKRDRSAVTLRYVKDLPDGISVKRSPDGSGCGVSDVIAFALRLVLIKATGCESILIADEPFKWLGRDQIIPAAALLKYLSEKLNTQIIISSHHPELKDVADHSYWLKLDEEEIVQIISEE
jgi:DNA repair exonuclease SbcCD ATPase subunit